MTQPNMSLTPKQLLLNHSRGMGNSVHVYNGEYFDTEIPRFDDITDYHEYKKNLAEEFKEKNKALQEAVEQRKQEIAIQDAKNKETAKEPPQNPPQE